MLTVYRRHSPECEFYGKARNARGARACRSRCPLWVQGIAQWRVRAQGAEPELLGGRVSICALLGIVGPGRCRSSDEIPTIQEAVEKFVSDGEARNLNPESVKKLRDAVERLFLSFCAKKGHRLLKQLGVDEIREFRNTLVKRYAATSTQTRLEHL